MTYTKAEMAWAFNEWMRRYTDEPEAFEAEWKTVMKFLGDNGDNNSNRYGIEQAEYFVSLLEEP